MRLADAPEQAAEGGIPLTFPSLILRGDTRLEALFAPFRECVVVHEALLADGPASRATRLLMAEIRADRSKEVRTIVRRACPDSKFEEQPTERDDVAGGTEWRERAGALSVSLYRLFGGSTALHVASAKTEAIEAPLQALTESPLAVLVDLVRSTSSVVHLSCTRGAGELPQWHLQSVLRDLRRFEELAPRLAELGFEERSAKYWREQIIVQPVGKDRWMAALPGVDFRS